MTVLLLELLLLLELPNVDIVPIVVFWFLDEPDAQSIKQPLDLFCCDSSFLWSHIT